MTIVAAHTLAMSIPDIDLDDIQILFDNHPDFITQGRYTPCHLVVMMKDPDRIWLC